MDDLLGWWEVSWGTHEHHIFLGNAPRVLVVPVKMGDNRMRELEAVLTTEASRPREIKWHEVYRG